MNRRTALKHTASILGASILGAETFLKGVAVTAAASGFLTKKDIRLLDEIGETILPASDRSPGAKAAHIGVFMQAIVTDCYSEEERSIFKSGLQTVRQTALEKYGRHFLNLSPKEQLELLSEFDDIASRSQGQAPVHFFTMMKQLTVWGYFSSEPGATQAMRYDPVPGGYDGCVAYKNGDRAWYGPLSSIG